VRYRSPLAFAGVFIVLLLAVMGFAAFSTGPVETAKTADGVVLPPTASGRVAGAVLGSELVTTGTAVPATEAPVDNGTLATSRSVNDSAEVAVPSTTTTPAAPATTVPPTTTTAPPATTAPPTTTTTTTPPATTAPPTTTAPPDNDAPPADHPPAVEQWRSVVATYWPAELVDDALTVISCESHGDPNAVNASSGAAGLFQFIPSTWDSAAAQAGWEGADVLDPAANVAVANWLFNAYATPWQPWSCKP
jgi:hypothetical protein